MRALRRFWRSSSVTVRLALVVECVFAVLALTRDAIATAHLCAAICEDKQITIWDVAKDNAVGFVFDVALALLTVCAVVLARRFPVASVVVAAIPVVTFVAMLLGVAVSAQLSLEAMQAVLATFLVPAAACATVAIVSVRRLAASARHDGRSTASTA